MDQRHQTRDQGCAPCAVGLRLDQRGGQLLQGYALRRVEELRDRQGKLPGGAVELHRGKIDPDYPVGHALRSSPRRRGLTFSAVRVAGFPVPTANPKTDWAA